MSNSILTLDMITREALDILHQNLTFIRGINREYDSQYAVSGAKIGSTLRIRNPNQFTVRTGRVMDVQDVTETKQDLVVATQKGVDTEFTSVDLALSIDDMRTRFLEPQMAVLAAAIESDALVNMTKQVYNLVDDDGAVFDFHSSLRAGGKLTENLCPLSNRTLLCSPDGFVSVVESNKTLFNDQSQVSKQYREGLMGRAAGFDWAQSTHVLNHTTGTAVEGDSLYNVTATSSDGATLTVDTGTTTFAVGDVIEIAGVFRVHPETKISTGKLQQFVITAAAGASATSLSISPAIVASGARQNVSNVPGSNAAVNKIGAGASETLNSHLAYHRDAFTFVSADLPLPTGGAKGSRQMYDGISLRLVEGYDIVNDTRPYRFDVLYGYKAIRPEWAVRVHADG